MSYVVAEISHYLEDTQGADQGEAAGANRPSAEIITVPALMAPLAGVMSWMAFDDAGCCHDGIPFAYERVLLLQACRVWRGNNTTLSRKVFVT